jgi:hypothetical protein
MTQESTVAERRAKIAEGVRAAADRVNELRDELIAAEEKPLLRGEWRIRDALSHLAARSNPVALAHLRIAEQGQERALTVDEVNHGQVDERSDLSVAALVDEIVAGSEAALAELDTLSDEFLEQTVKVTFGSGEMAASAIILFGGPRHFHEHLGDIEEALRA